MSDIKEQVREYFQRDIKRGINAQEVAIDLDLISSDPKQVQRNHQAYQAVTVALLELTAEAALVSQEEVQSDGGMVTVYWAKGNEPQPEPEYVGEEVG